MDELIAVLKSDVNLANAVGALASALAAFLALLISAVSVFISVRTSKAQQAHNELSVRPLADVTFADLENSLRVKLVNNGTGPLVLKAVNVSDGQRTLSSIIEWMPDLPNDRHWTYFAQNFNERSLRPGGEIVLIELTEEDGESDFAEARDIVRRALASLTVNVEYTDIYGKSMRPLRKSLGWFGRWEASKQSE